jgi:hypothetical protein
MSAAIESKAFPNREAGTLAPLMECARCNSQARILVEDSLTEGLECAVIAVCVEHAVAIANELGDSLGGQLIAKRMGSL